MSLLSHGATVVLNSRLRAHGSSHAYGSCGYQAMILGLRAWMALNVPSEMSIMLSSPPSAMSAARVSSGPAQVQINFCGSGRWAKPVLAPHQLSSRRYVNSVGLMLDSLYAPVPTGHPLAGS